MIRTYDMTNRSARASETTERIVAVTEEMLATIQVGEITLQSIAERSDLSVQTVLRHMGSRDGCFRAVRERVYTRIRDQLGHSEPGDVGAAVSELFAHYEAEGQLVLNLLLQEDDAELFAQEAVESGRAFHRAWVERCFGPVLNGPDEEAIDALVVITDLYVWKLLRLDLRRSETAAQAVVTRMVRTLLEEQ